MAHVKLSVLLQAFPSAPERGLPISMDDCCKVRDIIAATISEELACAKIARSDKGYLSAREIAAQALMGKIALPKPPQPPPSAEDEIAKACRSFETGTTQIVIDGHIARSLDEEVILRPDSQVRFIRVLPLAGG